MAIFRQLSDTWVECVVAEESVKGVLALCMCMSVVFCSAGMGAGQQETISANATNLERALTQLRSTPDDPTAQRRYLEAFPHTYKEYLQLFDLGQPLYDGHDYVEGISSLAKNHELAVGKLLVNLSKDAHYDADAPSYLQQATCVYGSRYTRTFLALLKELAPIKQANLITFLADVENHRAYPEYEVIIDHSKALGEAALAKKFELARAKREKQPHY